jgi:PadR family transcriptional regulator, regulatory protein PadR
MPAPQSDLLQGTLYVLILKALALQELHGMGISRRIAQMTSAAFNVKAGSLVPALHRMEQAGGLTSAWGESETNRRAKFYSLTKDGRRQLQTETERWGRISLAMGVALGIS